MALYDIPGVACGQKGSGNTSVLRMALGGMMALKGTSFEGGDHGIVPQTPAPGSTIPWKAAVTAMAIGPLLEDGVEAGAEATGEWTSFIYRYYCPSTYA